MSHLKKIALIAPIKDIWEKAQEIIANNNYEDISIHLATMDEGLNLARELIKDGVEIIISRGGTYQIIAENLDIPVVEIKTNTSEILEGLARIKGKYKKIGIIGYGRIISGIDYISPFLNFEVEKIIVENPIEIPNLIKKYKNKGIEFFLGDTHVKDITGILGKDGMILNSTSKSIEDAIDEALNILNFKTILRRRSEKIQATINNVHEGIIVVNSNQIITDCNIAAQDILGYSKSSVIDKIITDIIPSMELKETIENEKIISGAIYTVKDIKIISNINPIISNKEIIGAVVTFQDITVFQKNEIKLRKELSKKGFVAKYTFKDILFKSNIMKNAIKTAKKFAAFDAPIHINGETGTGKELFCQSIHNYSSRRKGPFIAINCSALPENLIESELFGYERGSFTGASREGKAGVFELAHGGTLFLDEIIELPIELQGRLLRALQEKEIMRVGGDTIIPVDVRVITAANKNLMDEVRNNHFRKDLYYRINVLELKLPNLKERKGDIRLLINYFLNKYSLKYSIPVPIVDEGVYNKLENMDYEGNVRELENLIHRSVILGNFDFLENLKSSTKRNDEILTLEEKELEYINEIYNWNNKDIEKTYKDLGISRTTLWRKLK